VAIDVAGDIVTSGDRSPGIRFINWQDDGEGDTVIDVSGSISTSGDGYSTDNYTGIGNQGIAVHTKYNDTFIDVSGTVTTSGENAAGILSGHKYGGTTTITSTGAVMATGEEAIGIEVEAYDGVYVQVTDVSGTYHGLDISTVEGPVEVTVDGTVVGGIDGGGIVITAPVSSSTAINADGSVGAASGLAIDTTFYDDTESEDSVTSYGVIAGNIVLGDGSDSVLFGDDADLSLLGTVDGGDDTSVADGFIDTLTFNGITADIAPDGFENFELFVVDDAQITLSGAGMLMTSGDDGYGAFVQNNSWLGFGMGVDLEGNLHVDATSAVSGAGANPTVYGDLFLEGAIDLVDGSADDTFTVTGNALSDGGVLAVDAGFSGFSAITGDGLVIEGDLTGDLLVDVNLLEEVSPEVDDPLVVVEGEVDGTVSLLNPIQGIVSFDLKEDGDSQRWYLVNDGVLYPVNAYEALNSVVGAQLLRSMGTLRQRVGAPSMWDPKERVEEGLWFRGVYDHSKGDAGLTENAGRFKGDRIFGQLGLDLLNGEKDDRSWVGTVFGTIGSSEVDNFDIAGARVGETEVDDYGFGVGFTWYRGGNFFIDAVFQMLWHDINMESLGNITANTDGDTIMASLEAGYRFDLDDGWYLSPEAQVIWSRTDIDDYEDSVVLAVVHGNKGKSVVGRFGMTLEKDDGDDFVGYLKASLVNEFEGDGGLWINGQLVGYDHSGAALELQAGGAWRLSERTYLFGEFSYTDDFSNSDVKIIGGKLGAKTTF